MGQSTGWTLNASVLIQVFPLANIFFHVSQGRCNVAAIVTPHVNSEKLGWLLQRDLSYPPEKYLTELQIEAKLTHMLGDKGVAQTAGEREVLMKDFRMKGIHSC